MVYVLAKTAPVELISAIAVMAAILTAAFFAVIYIRRKILDEPESENSSSVFSLDELRRLHREGSLSDEEYARAREAIIGSVTASINGDTDDQHKQ